MYSYLPFEYLSKGMSLGEFKFKDFDSHMQSDKEITDLALNIDANNLLYVKSKYFNELEKSGVNLVKFIKSFDKSAKIGILFSVACNLKLSEIYENKELVRKWIIKSFQDDSFDFILDSLKKMKGHYLLNNVDDIKDVVLAIKNSKESVHAETFLNMISSVVHKSVWKLFNEDEDLSLIQVDRFNFMAFLKKFGHKNFKDFDSFKTFYEKVAAVVGDSLMVNALFIFEEEKLNRDIWKYLLVRGFNGMTNLDSFHFAGDELKNDNEFVLEVFKEAKEKKNKLTVEFLKIEKWLNIYKDSPELAKFLVNNVSGVFNKNMIEWFEVADTRNLNEVNRQNATAIKLMFENVDFNEISKDSKENLKRVFTVKVNKALGLPRISIDHLNDEELKLRMDAFIKKVDELSN